MPTSLPMPRIARIALEGIPYHVTQRGNGRQQVFFDERDYRLYLDLLQEHCEDASLAVLGYCLMPNHIHLVVIPRRSGAMSSALSRTHANFARYFNLQKRLCGHVWQSRFFSTPLDATHLWHALAYVERNPVRARLVQQASQYPWSSTRKRLGMQAPQASFLVLAEWSAQYSIDRWAEVLNSSIQEEAFGQRLREASRRGRPLGTAEFTQQLEQRSGRKLSPQPVGRPKLGCVNQPAQ